MKTPFERAQTVVHDLRSLWFFDNHVDRAMLMELISQQIKEALAEADAWAKAPGAAHTSGYVTGVLTAEQSKDWIAHCASKGGSFPPIYQKPPDVKSGQTPGGANVTE